jgi:TPR repeat protein
MKKALLSFGMFALLSTKVFAVMNLDLEVVRADCAGAYGIAFKCSLAAEYYEDGYFFGVRDDGKDYVKVKIKLPKKKRMEYAKAYYKRACKLGDKNSCKKYKSIKAKNIKLTFDEKYD